MRTLALVCVLAGHAAAEEQPLGKDAESVAHERGDFDAAWKLYQGPLTPRRKWLRAG